MKTVLPLALFLLLLLLPASRVQATSCGQVTIKGCCTGATLSFCQAGALKQVDCTSQPSCGWDAKLNYYACGTQGGADPSGKHPKSCPATSDAGATLDATSDASGAGDGPALDLPPVVLDSGVRYDLGVQWDGLGGDAKTPPPDSSGSCNLGGGEVNTLVLLPALLLLLLAGRRS